MKHMKSIIRVFALLALLAGSSCTKNFDTYNRNPYQVTKEEEQRDGYIVRSRVQILQSFVIPTGDHLNQFAEILSGCAFAGYMSSTPNWTQKFATYNPPVDWSRSPFNDLFTNIYPNYRDLLKVTDDEIVMALGEICRIAGMHRVTDVFGPIPYTEMVTPGAEDRLSNPYDSQETVYKAMLADLDGIIDLLTENKFTSPEKYKAYDNVYSGDIVKWVKFCNSLKLRMAMRLSYVEPTLAQSLAEEAVAHEVGVMTDAGDIARLTVSKNPMVTQVNEWNDERSSADIVNFMNSYKDPRREKYFAKTSFETADNSGWSGLRNGIDVADKNVAMQYSMPLFNVDSPIMWMNAAEVYFLRAEGALRGWAMGDTPENLYNEGIRASFTQHGVAGADTYLANDTNIPTGYVDPMGNYSYGAMTDITIKWDDTADFEKNLERIITQKWIANFPLGNESWAEFRRTGYPKLMPIPQNKSNGAVPAGSFIKRLSFPDTEYSENMSNLMGAIKMLGGPDTFGTKLWWDKK